MRIFTTEARRRGEKQKPLTTKDTKERPARNYSFRDAIRMNSDCTTYRGFVRMIADSGKTRTYHGGTKKTKILPMIYTAIRDRSTRRKTDRKNARWRGIENGYWIRDGKPSQQRGLLMTFML